ncbi:MAG: hypothetical protein ACM3SQ_04635 [Betaproteobacteria bacterium]
MNKVAKLHGGSVADPSRLIKLQAGLDGTPPNLEHYLADHDIRKLDTEYRAMRDAETKKFTTLRPLLGAVG